MSRWIPALVLAIGAPVFAQDPQPPQPPAKSKAELKRRNPDPSKPGPSKEEKEALPPEEDASIAVKNYAFNPVQAQKEVRTGNYYFKKGSYRAAAGRFAEATRWNGADPEAWLRLGETEEKLKDHKAAREAYAKYLELAADAKNAEEIRKKLEKLK
jgi:tetratricopeptide (TPR) repeat protein